MQLKKSVRSFIFCLLLSAASSLAFSAPRGAQDLIPSGHWVYDALIQLELDSGRFNFCDQAPMSVQQVRACLDDVVYEALSEPGKELYANVLEYLGEKNWSANAGIFNIGFEPTLNVEGYYKTNEDIDWIYNYHERKPIVDLPIRLDLGDYFTAYMGLKASQNRTVMTKNDNYVNQSFTPDTFDPFLARNTYASTGHLFDNGVGFNVRLGTGAQSIGDSLFGSVIQSDYMTDTAYFNLSVYSPIFQYVMNITQLNRDTYMYFHRLEFRFFKKLAFSFLEGVLPYSAFDLRFLNPLGVYHGFALFNEYKLTSYFAFKINYVPVRCLRFYVLYAQDEHQLASEKSSGADYVPEAIGAQGGFQLNIPAGSGFVRFTGEAYYASPYLYIKESPNWTFARTYREMVSGTEDFYEWIGSPLGPDSIAGKVRLGYQKPQRWSIDLSYLFGARGEFSSSRIFSNAGWNTTTAGSLGTKENPSGWIYPAKDNEYKGGADYTAPHGTPEYINCASIKAQFMPKKWLTVDFEPGYTFVFNRHNREGYFAHGFEAALSVRIGFTRLFTDLPHPDFFLNDKYDRQNKALDNGVTTENE